MKPELINQAMTDGIALRRQCTETLTEVLLEAAGAVVDCLKSGGKILACGNGGSAADAQHFAAELVNRFEINRKGLPAVALTHDASVITSIANDFSFDRVFSRQVEALGKSGDLLLAISTSGTSNNITAAADAAAAIGMKTIALTGRDGGDLGRSSSVNVHINIPHSATPRIQEMHITCLHILCSLVDDHMFGEKP
ncbi:phosphoheptose isomerase [Mariprofundus ferrinatatus]|jgi:phosphoheptose isomerase|uniref:Phosphoheptose isomerase n=1 Tax=Mariprofundus ferrinatatus TaxID=1921087 RepID=A0A2K8L8S5_9PROT|nr:SIS domain-containing protein [Mariprofundus ferrinatatus]ATX81334.1 phosphoheptose isomerase [Mariprofundus ferrinatatus]